MSTTQSSSGRVIGIIGGMGPEATVELMRQIIRRTPARDDADHVRMLVDNNPKVPSRIAYLLEGGDVDPAPTLVSMARGLERSGATMLAMPCNTAHAFAPAIRDAVGIPFVDMIDAALDDVRETSPAGNVRFGVLGSPALRRIGTFDKKCDGTDLQPLYSNEGDEAAALAIIRSVKSGDLGPDVLARYQAIKQGLFRAGASLVLVCCTEFSVLEEKLGAPETSTLDSMSSLVTRLL
jgi:aspartate racemase